MDGNDEMTGEEGPSRGELERIRAERDRLQARVEALETRPERRHRLRRVLAPLLAALTVIVFTVAVPGAWARRTVLSTDRYVEAIGPLADDPRVQEYLARTVTDQVFIALDVQRVIADALPDQADVIAAPLANAARGFVQDQVLRVLQTDAFQRFWTEANRFVHTQVLAVLDGRGETISVREGKVLLNLLPLVNLALEQIGTLASGLLPGEAPLPEIRVDEVPEAAVAKVELALGVDLPDDFGAIVVFDSTELEALQRAVRLFDRLVVFLVVLFVILLAATLWASVRKRRTLLQVSAGSALGLVLVRRLALASIDRLVDRVRPENKAAATALTDELMAGLLRYTGVLLVISLAVIVVALVTGPYPWASRLRGWAVDLGRAVAAAPGAARREPVAAWIRAHRDALVFGGAAVGVATLFFFDLSFLGFLVVVSLLALFEVAVFRVAASAGIPAAEEAGGP